MEVLRKINYGHAKNVWTVHTWSSKQRKCVYGLDSVLDFERLVGTTLNWTEAEQNR